MNTTLEKPSLGVASLVFLIVAAASPLVVVAGGGPAAFGITGTVALPIGYVLLGIVLILFAVGYGALASRVENAGAFYACIADGLGPRQGIGASWLALISYNLMQIGLYGIFGYTLSSALGSRLGVELPWWLCALLALVIVAVLGVNKIDLSVKVIAVLVSIEVLIVIAIDTVALSTAPEGLSAQPLDVTQLFAAGGGAVLSFGISAFMGFESAAIYSEEAKDPRRTIPRATYIAVALIAAFYFVSTYAVATGVGPSSIVAVSSEQGPDTVVNFLSAHGHTLLTDVTQVFLLTSIFTALLAFHNAVARYFFSLGREGVIHPWLGTTSRRSQAPYAGSLVQSCLALVCLIIFAIAGHNSPLGPLFPVRTMFAWLCNAGSFGLIFLLAVTSIAVIGHFHRKPHGWSLWVRVIAPTISSVALIGIFVLIILNFPVLIGDGGPAYLAWAMPGAIILTGVAGLVWGEYLRRHRPVVFAGVGSGQDPYRPRAAASKVPELSSTRS